MNRNIETYKFYTSKRYPLTSITFNGEKKKAKNIYVKKSAHHKQPL